MLLLAYQPAYFALNAGGYKIVQYTYKCYNNLFVTRNMLCPDLHVIENFIASLSGFLIMAEVRNAFANISNELYKRPFHLYFDHWAKHGPTGEHRAVLLTSMVIKDV